MGSTLLATLFASNYVKGWGETVSIPSPVGTVRVPVDQASQMGSLLATVHAGETLFVYPYMPVQYFYTQTKNPTEYCALGPGSTRPEDESKALAELRARPPEWLLYMQLSREEFLRVFPNGTNLNYRLERVESWMQENYRPMEDPSVSVGGYRLWRHVTLPETAAIRP